MTPRTRKYFRRRIQRKYFALTAVTTFMGAMQLEMIRQQPLPKYPLGTPATGGFVFGGGSVFEPHHPLPDYIKGGVHTGGIAMVGEHGAEFVMPTKESIERMRTIRNVEQIQSVNNTIHAISNILADMKRKTDKI